MKNAIALSSLLFATVCGATEDKKPGLGMWVWSQAAFDTADARNKLMAFCGEEGIQHLDQHVGIEHSNGRSSLKNADALMALTKAAQEKGVTVNALRGSAKMFFGENHKKALDDLRAIVEFDSRLPEKARLAGVKYDVEPYGTKEWKAGGGQREKVMRDYLSFLQKAKGLLRKQAPHLELSVDVPFWWDKPEFVVEYAGKRKLLVHHVQDLTDYIGIMSYRPSAEKVLSVIQGELAYASRIGKKVCPGLETGKLEGEESWITFWGRPEADFRRAVAELGETLSGGKTTRCIMLHHYESLRTYLGKDSNKPDAGGK